MVKLNAKQLRSQSTVHRLPSTAKNDIYIILEDVLDTYNVGAIFRLADAIAARKVYLCGGTQTPPNSRIKKSSINTTEIVDWEYAESAIEAIEKVRNDYRLQTTDYGKTKKAVDGRRWTVDLQIIAVEQAKNSMPYAEFNYKMPLALLVGNESYGVLPSTLKKVDAVVELPMFGVNVSLNVMVSLGIVLYKALEKSQNSGK